MDGKVTVEYFEISPEESAARILLDGESVMQVVQSDGQSDVEFEAEVEQALNVAKGVVSMLKRKKVI